MAQQICRPAASPTCLYSAIIFDLGDVLFSWSADTNTTIPSQVLKKIRSTCTWFAYERGKISQGDCYERLGNEFGILPTEIETAFRNAHKSLRCDERLVDFITSLKAQSPRPLSIYAMSNTSGPDSEEVLQHPVDWSLFDGVFFSGVVGHRKPELGFYEHVISKTGLDPKATIFVDDNLENVISARSFGMTALLYKGFTAATQALCNLLGDPVERGQVYLRENAGSMLSCTTTGIAFQDNFAQFLILQETRDRDLVKYVKFRRLANFFEGSGVVTTKEFPCDLDTTSLYLMVTNEIDPNTAHSIMDEMLTYRNSDGVIQVYFDKSRPRVDPVVCLNVLSLFYAYGRGSDPGIQKTLEWVRAVLLNRAYIDGTRYYVSAEAFLYFYSRLISHSKDPSQQSHRLLAQRLTERIGSDGSNPLALAMRILACATVGIIDDIDGRRLAALQGVDGGWEEGWIYRFVVDNVFIGNKGLTTAFAVSALKALQRLRSQHFDPPVGYSARL